MAYLDFSAVSGAPAMPALRAPAPAAAEDFSPLEWTVIDLARRDRLSSLGKPGRIAAAVARLLGRTVQPSLADPRLEALRRFAVLAWHHGYVLPTTEIRRFVSAGFSAEQAETLTGHTVLASVKPARAFRAA
jgi:hypothetical protein